MQGLDASWHAWLQENLARQCNPEELLEILLKHGFALEDIKQSMQGAFPRHSPVLTRFGQHPEPIDHAALCRVRLTRRTADPRIKQFPTDKLQLFTIDDFLSVSECETIASLIRESLRRSTVTIESPTDKDYRTSSTSDLSLLKHRAVEDLDQKIAQTLGIYPAYAEGLQGQHYAVGQEFKQHTDFFAPGTAEYQQYAATTGNRTWTFMVYLNNVAAGGGTRFIELDHVFQPRVGMAVVWNNLHPNGSPNHATLHAGMPVLEGAKTIITKWFRERGAGPMCYAD